MADSDSDPFESADEGENESQKLPKDKQSKGGQSSSPSTKPDDHQDNVSEQVDKVRDLDGAQELKPQEAPEEQKMSQSEQTDDSIPEKDAKTGDSKESVELATDEQTSVEDSKEIEDSSANKSTSQSAETGSDSAENKAVERTSNKSLDSEPSENEDTTAKGDNEVRTEQEEPKAPEGQTMQGALDRLAGACEEKNRDEQQETKPPGGWGGWGGWGSSLLSSATSKVSQMGHGLSSVIENVESSLGVPKPEELKETTDKAADGGEIKEGEVAVPEKGENLEEKAGEGGAQDQQGKSDDQERSDTSDNPAQSPSSLGGWFSFGATALTSVVEKTVTGSLDALELIGKKTMDVLQEGDPGFRKKRAYISEKTGQSINLSQMLREAKETAEMASQMEAEQKEKEKVHFGILFDNYQGLAHLEALEMLSNQSEMKVHSTVATLSGEKLSAIQTELTEIKGAFQVEDLESDEIDDSIDEQDFVNLITEHLFGVCVAATPDKLQKVQKSAHEWLVECQKSQEDGEKKDAKELHIKAIETLAELTARSIEQFHKSAELMLLHQDKDQHTSLIQRATSLSKLTSSLCAELSSLASKFCERLNVVANDEATDDASESVNPIITNIYLEASNSASYIQDAFQLLLPVLQALAVENSMEEAGPDAIPAS